MLNHILPQTLAAILRDDQSQDTTALIDKCQAELRAAAPILIQAALRLEVPGVLAISSTQMGRGVLPAQSRSETITVDEVFELVVNPARPMLETRLFDDTGKALTRAGPNSKNRKLILRLTEHPVGARLVLADFVVTSTWKPDQQWFFSRALGRMLAQRLGDLPAEQQQDLMARALIEVRSKLEQDVFAGQGKLLRDWEALLMQGSQEVIGVLSSFDDGHAQAMRSTKPAVLVADLTQETEREDLRSEVKSDLAWWDTASRTKTAT